MKIQKLLLLGSIISSVLSLVPISIIIVYIIYGIPELGEWSYANYKNYDGVIADISWISLSLSLMPILILVLFYKAETPWYRKKVSVAIMLIAFINVVFSLLVWSAGLAGQVKF